MHGKEVAQQLREIIQGMKANGTSSIDVDALIAYLRKVEADPNAVATAGDQERSWQDQENARTNAKLLESHNNATYQMVNAAGEAAAKALFLLNGGAAIAMLAFVGQLAARGIEWAAPFGQPLLGFGWGALGAAGVYGCRYFAHWAWRPTKKEWHETCGHILNGLSIALGFVSFLLFAWSLTAANSAFGGLGIGTP